MGPEQLWSVHKQEGQPPQHVLILQACSSCNFFLPGVRQEPDGRAQAGLRRVQPVRHLRRELHPHLPGRGEGWVPILHGQVQARVQGKRPYISRTLLLLWDSIYLDTLKTIELQYCGSCQCSIQLCPAFLIYIQDDPSGWNVLIQRANQELSLFIQPGLAAYQ